MADTKKKNWSIWLIISACIIGIAIFTWGAISRARNNPTRESRGVPGRAQVAEDTIISTTLVTIGESWSPADIFIEGYQSAELEIVSGQASRIDIMDAEHPERGSQSSMWGQPLSVRRHMYRPVWRADKPDRSRPLVLRCTVKQ